MKLYIDIDGVLLNYETDTRADHSVELIDYITKEFDCYWLTTHCKGDAGPAVEYLSSYFSGETLRKLRKIKPTYWEDMKTEGIDFDSNFIWLDDYPFQAELSVLRNFCAEESLYRVNLSNKDELLNVMAFLKGIKEKKRKRRIMVLTIIISFLLALGIGKAIWSCIANRHLGNFETEKVDILERRNFLIDEVITRPSDLISKMPAAVGEQFQGEWALYSASMLTAALTNISMIYPETRREAAKSIDHLIKIVMAPEIRRYDYLRWGEDPLETLDGDESHISYLSHLAWMISAYNYTCSDGKYDWLFSKLCETMNRRILQSPNLNLQTYPGELIYVPDMLVAIVALANYSRQNDGKYSSTVHQWLEEMKTNWVDPNSGLIASFIPYEGAYYSSSLPVKGSYSALNCYYLTFVDEEFARKQYEILKTQFLNTSPITGFKEYFDRNCWLGMDIDAGPILFNLSPTGTAFGIGSMTYFEDFELRKKFLKTAELAGFTVTKGDKKHYLLADVALVGEAITLAMRTAVKWI